MRIYTSLTIDIATGEILEQQSYDYQGPVALCGDGGLMGDMGGGGDVDPSPMADAGGADTDVAVDIPDDVVGDEDVTDIENPELPVTDDNPEDDPAIAAGDAKAGKEVLPAALSKAIRELRSAHPEQASALKALNDAYYAARAYKQVFGSPDEARTTKAALEAVGGTEGIATMRADINSVQQFDNLAAEGNPRVVDALFDQFPDGAKRLAAPMLQRLSKSDPEAYVETMRGPFLQMLEGDGWIDVLGSAMEELKAATTEPEAAGVHYRNAQRELSRFAGHYQGLKKQETDYRGRWQDPKLKEMEARELNLQTQQSAIYRTNVVRDLDSYLQQTMKPGISSMLNGKTLTPGGRSRFEQNVTQEIHRTLQSNQHYVASLKDLVSKGKVEQAINFAKPFIDSARRNAIKSVYTDIYGSAPAARPKPKVEAPAPTNGQQRSPIVAGSKPIPIRQKPASHEIDWDKTTNIMFVTHKGYLTSGKFVQWP